ncbi:glycine--tRNA ligase subunit beta [Mesobacterium pallidum]|uniref:glycine--tRNA ligase subunit beta n=1 Tax=Mesobacterium pallidum TaxID=2872037 RepID=UPI001EE2A3EE|nr:glycine--tRNA ligase subunit beta [Mesobacterium pallidum]
MPDLLIELFSEEIPARMQKRAGEDLKKLVTDGLVEAGLTYASAGAFATPRRLALSVEGLLARSPDLREERKGPKVGAPDQAIEGFCRGAGVARDALQVRDDKKGQVYFAVIDRPGRPAAEIVAEVLEKTIRTFPWPKSMRWGAGSLRWVRPLHSILCILSDEAGAETVPLEVDGITAGNMTKGHRFMAPAAFSVSSFDDYRAKLRRAFVLLDPEERANHIWTDATNAAFAQGLELVEDAGLLAEVAGLVEWPVVLMGEIGADFLDLPPEVLQTSMKEHQKFFSVKNPKTGRIERFVTVANRETADNGATVLAGNQKVLAARLSDAKFFWENDLRIAKGDKMAPWVAQLENVTFHAKLGSQAARIARIAALSGEIAPMVGADAALAVEAAKVAKADLSSEMVYEFPELQGLMGRYYADAAGLPAEVAAACQEHYSPLGPSDDVPSAPVSVTVALADKLDTLTGFWAIDEKPTGSKDPYALRRAALGVIRLVLGNGVRVNIASQLQSDFHLHLSGVRYDVKETFVSNEEWWPGDFDEPELKRGAVEKQDFIVFTNSVESIVFNFDGLSDRFISKRQEVIEGRKADPHYDDYDQYNELVDEIRLRANSIWSPEAKTQNHIQAASLSLATDLLAFFHDRLKVHLRDEGVRHDVIDACLAMPGNDDLVLLVKRAEALTAFLGTEDGTNLLQGFKRANNILTQAEEKDSVEYSFGAEPKLAEDASETALFAALDAEAPQIAAAMKAEDFAAAMSALARLRAPIDAFFEAVQVNSDNAVIRRNRLNLLSRIRTLCLGVADLTKIEG